MFAKNYNKMVQEFTDKQFEDFKDHTSAIIEEFCWRSTVGGEWGEIADLLQKYILNDISSQLDTSLEYEMSLLWEHPQASTYIAEYVLERFKFLIKADTEQTVGSLLRNVVLMQKLAGRIAEVPKFNLSKRMVGGVCWMLILTTYDTIVNREFAAKFNQLKNTSALAAWKFYGNFPKDLDKISVISDRFDPAVVRQENQKVFHFLKSKCVDISLQACSIRAQLHHLSLELGSEYDDTLDENDSFQHNNSFSSIGESQTETG